MINFPEILGKRGLGSVRFDELTLIFTVVSFSKSASLFDSTVDLTFK